VARAVAFVPDLLFGSNVVGMLRAGGHDPVLVSSGDQLAGALPGADVLIVDLTADPQDRIEIVKRALGGAGRLRARRAAVADGSRGRRAGQRARAGRKRVVNIALTSGV
jgi:hypothetical protein